VTAVGVAARQFNATGSGARQLHEYDGNLRRDEAATAWGRGRPWLVRRRPRLQVALVHSLPDLGLRESGILGASLALARALRPASDFEVLDDHLVAAGALDGVRVAFLAPARWWSADTAARVRAFVAGGGICVASGARPALIGQDGGVPFDALFGFRAETEECVGISAVRVVEGGPLAAEGGEYRRLPPLHLARAYDRLEPGVVPLLRLGHTPASGRAPLVLWYRPLDRGAAVFYAGTFSAGDDWMAVRGASEALVRDILVSLPPALGMEPVPVAGAVGVLETWEEGDPGGVRPAVLGWNATDRPVAWRGAELGPWEIGRSEG